MATTIYSVIVSHEAEIHENHLFTDKARAIAKMDEIVQSWRDRGAEIHRLEMTPSQETAFGSQYGNKLGYWYESGVWEYGCVDLIECKL